MTSPGGDVQGRRARPGLAESRDFGAWAGSVDLEDDVIDQALNLLALLQPHWSATPPGPASRPQDLALLVAKREP